MIFFLLIVLFYSLLVNSFFGFKIPKKNTRKNEWFIYFPISLSLAGCALNVTGKTVYRKTKTIY